MISCYFFLSAMIWIFRLLLSSLKAAPDAIDLRYYLIADDTTALVVIRSAISWVLVSRPQVDYGLESTHPSPVSMQRTRTSVFSTCTYSLRHMWTRYHLRRSTSAYTLLVLLLSDLTAVVHVAVYIQQIGCIRPSYTHETQQARALFT